MRGNCCKLTVVKGQQEQGLLPRPVPRGVHSLQYLVVQMAKITKILNLTFPAHRMPLEYSGHCADITVAQHHSLLGSCCPTENKILSAFWEIKINFNSFLKFSLLYDFAASHICSPREWHKHHILFHVNFWQRPRKIWSYRINGIRPSNKPGRQLRGLWSGLIRNEYKMLKWSMLNGRCTIGTFKCGQNRWIVSNFSNCVSIPKIILHLISFKIRANSSKIKLFYISPFFPILKV